MQQVHDTMRNAAKNVSLSPLTHSLSLSLSTHTHIHTLAHGLTTLQTNHQTPYQAVE